MSNLSDMHVKDFETIELEIQREKAESLGRAGQRLEEALLKLQAFQCHLSNLLPSAGETSRDQEEQLSAAWDQKWVEYAKLREQVKTLRHALIIQREALGLWRHEDVDRQYPLPP